MLDMGFIRDISKIIALLPARRQNLMFSATFSPEIRKLAKGLIHDPVEVSVSPPNAAAKSVEQWVVPVDKSKKSALLIELIQRHSWYQVLVFCRTKHGANKLAYQLNKADIKAAPIHGNKSQGARTRALAEFKQGDIQVLVATDIAARGLDIDQLPQVVNFDLPHVAEDYVHRIGRTGRAGAEGKAVSLVCAAEFKELTGIERLIREVLPRRGVPGFTPKEKLPESPANLKPIKPKKPKKNRPVKPERHDGSRSDKASAKKVHEKSEAGKPAARAGKSGQTAGGKPAAGAGSRQRSRSTKGGEQADHAPLNDQKRARRRPRKRPTSQAD